MYWGGGITKVLRELCLLLTSDFNAFECKKLSWRATIALERNYYSYLIPQLKANMSLKAGF